jgi:transposase
MNYNFIECNREQSYLLPPSLADWLPEGHLAWFIIDAVGQVDLAPFYERYRPDGVGNAAFHPAMMVALLLYAYCHGERSSRKIESLCQTDVAHRVITANKCPDHSTISRFRKDNQPHLKKLFRDILRLCAEAGLVKLGLLSLDGTKIKANASLSANRTLKHLRREIDAMFTEAEKKDRAEDRLFGRDRRGDETPAELRNREARISRLKACRERLEREEARARRKQELKREQRQVAEAAGGKLRGRKPKEPGEAKECKANVTDPESRIMKTRAGFIQGYNAQAVVTEEQIIIAEDVTLEENDQKQLHPMLRQVEENRSLLGLTGKTDAFLADAGYSSNENLSRLPAGAPELFIATKNDFKQRLAAKDPPPGPEPAAGFTPVQLMSRKLLTDQGREIYKKRSQTVEPVFGQVKDVRKCDRFMGRGLDPGRGEWSLICATHNLLKLWRSGKAAWN